MQIPSLSSRFCMIQVIQIPLSKQDMYPKVSRCTPRYPTQTPQHPTNIPTLSYGILNDLLRYSTVSHRPVVSLAQVLEYGALSFTPRLLTVTQNYSRLLGDHVTAPIARELFLKKNMHPVQHPVVAALIVLSTSRRNASVIQLLPSTMLVFRLDYSQISHTLQLLYA